MAASARRVGAQTSKTRDALLDSVEKLMVKQGYASVSYRAVAATAGVTASLVQYYFPTLDDIFIAAIRRSTERNLARLTKSLQDRPDEPLRVLWEYSFDEATSALTIEFMALGNHRKSIRKEIADVTEQVRSVSLDALKRSAKVDVALPIEGLSPSALLMLITAIPKFLNLEEGIGVKTAHNEIVRVFEHYLAAVEPPRRRNSRPAKSRARR